MTRRLPDLPPLPAIPGGWTEESFAISGQNVRLVVPADADLLLDAAAEVATEVDDDYMPYWCQVWPAALEFARLISSLALDPNGTVLELGAGLGLVGIVAGLQGAEVVLSDYWPLAVQVARHNAALNRADSVSAQAVDWRMPASDRYSSILACDVLYEPRAHADVLRFVTTALAADGVCWIADPGRRVARDFVRLAGQHCRIRLYDRYLSPLLLPPENEFWLAQLSAKYERGN